MAEIGLIASVIQVAGAGLKLSQTLYHYAEGVATADRRVKDIAKEIELTSFVIEELGSIFKEDETSGLISKNAVKTANETMKECSTVFAEIDATLKKSRKNTLGRLMLPFRDSKIELLRSHIDKLKSTLQLLMQVLTHAHQIASKKLDREAEAKQREEIKELLENKKKSTKRYEESLRNYSVSDGSTIHNDDQDPDKENYEAISTNVFTMAASAKGSTINPETLGKCLQHTRNLLENIETLQQALTQQGDGSDYSEHHQSLVGSYLRARDHLDSVLFGNSKARTLDSDLPSGGYSMTKCEKVLRIDQTKENDSTSHSFGKKQSLLDVGDTAEALPQFEESGDEGLIDFSDEELFGDDDDKEHFEAEQRLPSLFAEPNSAKKKKKSKSRQIGKRAELVIPPEEPCSSPAFSLTSPAFSPVDLDPTTKRREPENFPLSGPAFAIYEDGATNADEESWMIKCICGYWEDDGNAVLCEKCNTWQHIVCFYESAAHVPDVHECTDCVPRPMDLRAAAEKQEQAKFRREALTGTHEAPKAAGKDLKQHTKSSVPATCRDEPLFQANRTEAAEESSQSGRVFKEHAAQLSDHESYDACVHPPKRTLKLEKDVDAKAEILRNTIYMISERGERLDSLRDKTDNLVSSAQAYRRGATKQRSSGLWNSVYNWFSTPSRLTTSDSSSKGAQGDLLNPSLVGYGTKVDAHTAPCVGVGASVEPSEKHARLPGGPSSSVMELQESDEVDALLREWTTVLG